jgi:ethanolamine utilization protein EutP
MLKYRAMLIGSVGSGKSTLTNKLLNDPSRTMKTQTLTYRNWIVDTPGEYTENPLYYKSIMATSLEVTHVMYIQDATNPKTTFPPLFATGISKLPIGVITKAESKLANITRAIQQLERTLNKGPIVITSAFTSQGIEELRMLVTCSNLNEMELYCLDNMENTRFYK